ncbi:MAG: 16S rRNA (guanine(966)-N(2))-methyltransferase RsmD [Bacteroidaceae bacterium]|nr:16S rRNA (guanine(966)-N(2))-methyltransferase RsmD [Bacteroidaceae bacterium]
MRIISGKYKGRHFDVPRNFKARPTTDFAKENLFNILTNIIDFEECTALDLFSGTGSISLELLSRGCKSVTSVEMDSLHFSFLKKSQATLNDNNWHITRDDVFRYLRRGTGKYDIIFADPPYALKELKDIPEIVLSGNMLSEEGIFIFEHGKEYDFSSHPNFFRHVAYGSVNFSFFAAKPATEG